MINLFIADENRLFREGLRRILPGEKFNIVGEFATLSDVMGALEPPRQEVQMMICGAPAGNLAELGTLKVITRQFPGLKAVLLADRASPGVLEMALDSGACGFLSRNISPAALLYSLEIILLGEQIFPTLQSFLNDNLPRPPLPAVMEDVGNPVPLSSREAQILGCLVNGQSNKTIARELRMAEATVKVHLRSLLRKLKATNRTQAAIRGMSNPLLRMAKIKQELDAPGGDSLMSPVKGEALDCELTVSLCK